MHYRINGEWASNSFRVRCVHKLLECNPEVLLFSLRELSQRKIIETSTQVCMGYKLVSCLLDLAAELLETMVCRY